MLHFNKTDLRLRRASIIALSSERFNLSDFEADLTIVDGLIPEKNHHATILALALACMQLNAKVDGADVEFVRGIVPKNLRLTRSGITTFPPRMPAAGIKNFREGRSTYDYWTSVR